MRITECLYCQRNSNDHAKDCVFDLTDTPREPESAEDELRAIREALAFRVERSDFGEYIVSMPADMAGRIGHFLDGLPQRDHARALSLAIFLGVPESKAEELVAKWEESRNG